MRKFSLHSSATTTLAAKLSHHALVLPGLTQNRLGFLSFLPLLYLDFVMICVSLCLIWYCMALFRYSRRQLSKKNATKLVKIVNNNWLDILLVWCHAPCSNYGATQAVQCSVFDCLHFMGCFPGNAFSNKFLVYLCKQEGKPW